MNALRPYHYHYLINPFTCSAEDLLKYAFQDLCLRHILTIENRLVFLNKNDTRPSLRAFFKQGENYNSAVVSEGEVFLYTMFSNYEELRFYQIRNKIISFLKSTPNFKTECVYKELYNKNHCRLKYYSTKNGHYKMYKINYGLSKIEELITINSFDTSLNYYLNAVGTNVIFLKPSTLNLLANNYDFKEVNFNLDLKNWSSNSFRFDYFNTESFTDFSFSTTDFDGFDGGDFGGAGAGTDW